MSVATIGKGKVREPENGVCRPSNSKMTSWFWCLKKEKKMCFKTEKNSLICFYREPVPSLAVYSNSFIIKCH